MRTITTERGAIIHFAGFHRMSPALDDGGRPAFSVEIADGLARCGWERFFAALRAGGLALEHDPTDAASARFVPASEARQPGHRREAFSRSLEHAARFWRALVS